MSKFRKDILEIRVGIEDWSVSYVRKKNDPNLLTFDSEKYCLTKEYFFKCLDEIFYQSNITEAYCAIKINDGFMDRYLCCSDINGKSDLEIEHYLQNIFHKNCYHISHVGDANISNDFNFSDFNLVKFGVGQVLLEEV